MKTNIYYLIFLSILLASCSSLQQSTVNDDIYYSPKDEVAISGDVYVNPTNDKQQSTMFNKKYDKEISAVLEDETKSEIDTVIYKNEDEYENPYESIVVDSYAESYQRRLDAMQDPSYGMNNNYFLTLSDDYWYAQAYFNDPFYNVVIVGDHIWVEPYWMSSWTYNRYPSYYGSYYYGSYSPYYSYYNRYYSPYYSPYYGSYYPYYSYNSYYPYSNKNDNYVSSSFHSFRQRSLAGTSGTRSAVGRSSRELPETYVGRNISPTSTVKSGIDRQTARTTRTGEVRTTTRTGESNITRETIRVSETNRERSGSSISSTNTNRQSGTVTGANRNYVRPQQGTRSTYSSPSSSVTRYNRPESTRENVGRSSTGTTRTSTYSPRSSGTSRSGYTPSKSSGSSGSSSVRSSTRSSGSSGSVSSGSSRSSGSSSGSSSTKSSSGSSSSGRGRR